ncbi:MAG: cobalamin B12-binding domain-containing protein [Rhodospirillales bacterium]|nr:cobalamin B12-binding domain-containing protein [Rhodospirillales bacterium]
MKVLLIAPPYPLAEGPSAPLGLCYVAAAFEKAHAEVKILDYIVFQYSAEKLKNELTVFKPDLVGITSVTLNFNQAADIIRTARQLFPSAVTVMGGPHVSFDYESTLRKYPEIDLIVIGEGEETISELTPVIRNRGAWHRIKGLAFLEAGELIVTPPRERIQDLDSIPLPARDLLPISRYLALGFPISIITSRGCPNRCIFCQGHRMVGNRVRSRNPKIVVDEIESLLRYGFQRFNFSDDFFTSNVNRVKAICEEIQRRGLEFSWAAFARADSVTPELLQIMRRAGCDTIFFGMESGNQEMLDRVRKRVKLDRIRQAVADSKAADMQVFGSFIVGLPGETKETLMDSHRFAEELDIMYGYHFLAPFPGTTVHDQMDQYDLELLSNNWSDFDANSAIVQTSALSAAEIEDFVEEFYMKTVRKVEERVEKECQDGTANATDQMVYLGNKRLNVIFKLLSEDIIEKLLPIPAPLNGNKPGVQIAEQIAEQIEQPLTYVLSSVQNLIDRGLLQVQTVDNHLLCSWA